MPRPISPPLARLLIAASVVLAGGWAAPSTLWADSPTPAPSGSPAPFPTEPSSSGALPTRTPTRTATVPAPTATPTVLPPTATASPTPTPSRTPTPTATATATVSATSSPVPTVTASATATGTQPPAATATATRPASATPSASPSPANATAVVAAPPAALIGQVALADPAPAAPPPAAIWSAPSEPALTLAQIQAMRGNLPAWAYGPSLQLSVPWRTQLDGSPFNRANCGPSSLAMVMEAFGLRAQNHYLRLLANAYQGVAANDYDAGLGPEALIQIAEDFGLRSYNLYRPGGGYRTWTLDDLRADLAAGHPVITLVHYRSLPGNEWSRSGVDHWIVITGSLGQGFIYNDPAFVDGGAGRGRVISPDQLRFAWQTSSVPTLSFGLGPGGTPRRQLPVETAQIAPPADLAAVPRVSPPPGAPASVGAVRFAQAIDPIPAAASPRVIVEAPRRPETPEEALARAMMTRPGELAVPAPSRAGPVAPVLPANPAPAVAPIEMATIAAPPLARPARGAAESSFAAPLPAAEPREALFERLFETLRGLVDGVTGVFGRV